MNNLSTNLQFNLSTSFSTIHDNLTFGVKLFNEHNQLLLQYSFTSYEAYKIKFNELKQFAENPLLYTAQAS